MQDLLQTWIGSEEWHITHNQCTCSLKPRVCLGPSEWSINLIKTQHAEGAEALTLN